MVGPWRVRFVHNDDPVWNRLVETGLIPADGGRYELFEAARADPARVMGAAGGFMPWPFFGANDDAPGAPPLGCFAICPQCGQVGSIGLRNDPRYPHATWNWNGSAESPTVNPSIHNSMPDGCGGHYWLRDGVLTDCGGHRPL